MTTQLYLANKWGGCNQRSREACEIDLLAFKKEVRENALDECVEAIRNAIRVTVCNYERKGLHVALSRVKQLRERGV